MSTDPIKARRSRPTELQRLVARDLFAAAEAAFGDVQRPVTGWNSLAELASHLDRYLQLGDEVVLAFLEDVERYFGNQRVRAAALDVVERELEAAGGEVILLGYDLGSVVAYDLLRQRPQPRVRSLITLGSPLGLPSIRGRLGPHPFPAGIANWVNLFAPRDVVTGGAGLHDLFPSSGRQEVEDRPIEVRAFGMAHQAPHDPIAYLSSVELGATLREEPTASQEGGRLVVVGGPSQELARPALLHEPLEEAIRLGLERVQAPTFASLPIDVTPYGELWRPDLGEFAHVSEEADVETQPPPVDVPEREPRVNTGFAPLTAPAVPIDRNASLGANQSYYFWVEVKPGPPVPGAIDAPDQSPLPARFLPQNARLTVAVFAFPDELAISSGQDAGVIELGPDGSTTVTSRAATPSGVAEELLGRRLFFPIATPANAGRCRLRCNFYHEGILVQSHLVEAQVHTPPQSVEDALKTVVDYTLTHSLDPSHLSGMGAHRLSVMLNGNGNGTVDFHFYGRDGHKVIKENASFGEGRTGKWIDHIREGLRQVSWGSEKEWNPNDKEQEYRYQDRRFDQTRLEADLMILARRGWLTYTNIVVGLAKGGANANMLQELMQTPGLVQIALRNLPNHVFPAAVLYDYDLEENAENLSLCPAFLGSLGSDESLERARCFNGACPSRGQDRVVCPSGFWGFRHALGVPLSIEGAPDAPTALKVDAEPRLSVAVSLDPNFVERDGHITQLRTLAPELEYIDTRQEAIDGMKSSPAPHLFYLYCHGGIKGTFPYLKIGMESDYPIETSFFFKNKIRWETDPRPVFFINGCHTTAVEPEQAAEFVSQLVGYAYASGVIGTEVTIFEPLAADFAEAFLRRFLKGEAIGYAVRGARLELLKQGNPLGLAYIPFVLASLHLAKQAPVAA